MEKELLIPSRVEGMPDDARTEETIGLKPEAAKAASPASCRGGQDDGRSLRQCKAQQVLTLTKVASLR
jgi:hypothetical protein